MASKDRVERRLAAIFSADIAGYSRLIGVDELGTLRDLMAHREKMDGLIAHHGGRIANTAGDSILAEFPSVVDAVECAAEIQELVSKDPSATLLRFRIGVHVGDVLVRGGDLFGDGVNIAARLQALAQPGSVCVSGATYEQVKKVLPLSFTDLGPQQVKNIEEPIRAHVAGRLGDTPSAAALANASKSLPLPD